MAAEKMEWMMRGDACDACDSPPMCPIWWGSPVQEQLHDGHNHGEGAFTFYIREGYYGDINLSGLIVGFGMNTPDGDWSQPWPAILYIDSKADEKQAKVLEEIFKEKCHGPFQVLKVKRAKMSFIKQQIGPMDDPGYRQIVDWEGFYHVETESMWAMNGGPRTLSGMADNSKVYACRSLVNKYNDPDLPRGKWDAPGNSAGCFEFSLNSQKLYFDP